jgi:hypothetical protein
MKTKHAPGPVAQTKSARGKQARTRTPRAVAAFAEERIPPMPPRSKVTIEELWKASGKKPCTIEDIVGIGKDWWASDEECEAFVNAIYERRREGLKK